MLIALNTPFTLASGFSYGTRNGATIVSGTSTSYGTNVTTSGAVNTSYNLSPGYKDFTNGAKTVYYKVTGGDYYNDKTGIYLDEYKKIYIVNYKISVFYPKLTEYDLNIYPKSNVYNLKEINKIKDLLTKDNDKYTYILYGCILSTIVDER